MNIIIVGCGKVGATLVMTLSKENNNISVIDTDPDVVDQIAGVADMILHIVAYACNKHIKSAHAGMTV